MDGTGTARRTRQPPRTAIVVGAVVAAYVAFAVFAQLIGEDETNRGEALQLNAFCTAVYADYPSLLVALVSQDGFGGVLDPERSVDYLDSFLPSPELAPAEFRDEVAYLAEGLRLAAGGQLPGAEVNQYIEAYDELQTAATPVCDQVGADLQFEDLDELGDTTE